jgi:transposase
MIGEDRRKAIFLLHQEGMQLREIARRLHVSRNTVRTIIEQGGVMPKPERAATRPVEAELLRRLYGECDGWIMRVHEELLKAGIKIAYPTLTHRLRALGISPLHKKRSAQVPDEPGLEMQHDTSVYQVKLGERSVRVIASLLYLRYSKRRYLRFYRSFNRFRLKSFLHEALSFWGYAARQCIIDNTNLARLRGTGRLAVIVPEMVAFARQYGFEFICHELGHSDRKAGEERSFRTVETNFFPGRSYQSLEDLNAQALDWATVRLENRPQGKAGLIPAKAFEHERGYLQSLPPHLPAPYLIHERETDQYGYIAFDGNYYWVPGTRRDQVKVLEYAAALKIYLARDCLAAYPLPPDGVRNEKFSPAGQPKPPGNPQHRRGSEAEEKHLRALGAAVGAYLDFVLPQKGVRAHEFIRRLLGLSRRMTVELFVKSLERARKYRISDVATIERIAVLFFNQGTGELPWVEVDEAFTQREAYREGSLTEPPDLSIYQDPPAPSP